jgi:hypothetical protein
MFLKSPDFDVPEPQAPSVPALGGAAAATKIL